MSDTKERAGAAGVVVAGVFFKIALYVCSGSGSLLFSLGMMYLISMQ